MQLTIEQLNAAEQGDAVRIEADGKTFVLLSQRIYDDSLDYSLWTAKEMGLLADEALKLVSGDGLDELDEAGTEKGPSLIPSTRRNHGCPMGMPSLRISG